MTCENSLPLGMIGVGLLGSAMARRWRAAGVDLLLYDVDTTRAQQLVEQLGARLASSASDVVGQCQTTVFSLPDSAVVKRVLDEVDALLIPGQSIVDTTTGSPDDAEEFSRRLRPRGIVWLDATVAGSSQQMLDGQAVMLVGGDQDSFQRLRPLFDALTAHVFWLGSSGSGAKMKLVVNLAIGLHRAVLAEALALANAMGLDLDRTLEVLKETPAYSRMMETKGEKMTQREFTPQARLAQHLKDVELMLTAARQHGQSLPLSELHRQILQSCVDCGDGGLDNSAVIRAWFQDPAP